LAGSRAHTNTPSTAHPPLLQKKFDEKYGPTWHCIVGTSPAAAAVVVVARVASPSPHPHLHPYLAQATTLRRRCHTRVRRLCSSRRASPTCCCIAPVRGAHRPHCCIPLPLLLPCCLLCLAACRRSSSSSFVPPSTSPLPLQVPNANNYGHTPHHMHAPLLATSCLRHRRCPRWRARAPAARVAVAAGGLVTWIHLRIRVCAAVFIGYGAQPHVPPPWWEA